MRKIKFFMNVFAFVFYVDTFEVVRKHKSDPWPNRDTFQKGVYSYRNEKIDITECNSTYVDGGVEADHSSSSSRICNCGTGETFYIDSTKLPPRPKCIRLFGNEELSCQFKFDGETSVLALKKNGANQNIGTIQYDYRDVKTIQQLNDIYVWNMTWQKEQQIPFSTDGPRLKWNTTSFSDLLVKYEGLLFKVVMRVRFQGSEITDSVLLKIEGKRKYPLQTYLAKSSKSDYISSTRKLPRFSTFKVIPTSSIAATRTTTPIHKSEISSILSKTSISFKTTPFVKSTQRSSIAVFFSSSSTPILQTSAAHSQTIRPLKTTRMSYLTVTPSESLASFKPRDSSFTIKLSSSYKGYNMRSSSWIRSSILAPSLSTESTVVLSSSIITNPGSNTGKQNSNNAGMITGISVGIIVAIAAVVAAFIIYRRRHPSLDEIRRRKGTMTLDLTSNTFSNRGLSFQNPVKNTVGNPMYADKLRFNSVAANGKSDTELYEYAYGNGKQKDEQPGEAIYKEIDEDGKMEPIYREIEMEEPIYHETESEYLPIDETKLDSPAKYEALDTATLPKKDSSYLKPVKAPIYQELEEENMGVHKDKAKEMPSDSSPLQDPIYQVLEDENDGKHNDNKDARNDVQSPVYQTLNPEVYEELDKNGAKSPGNVYSKLDLAAQDRPKQAPLYDVLARESGTSNSQYDDDEAEI